jgi:hypothetical protein
MGVAAENRKCHYGLAIGCHPCLPMTYVCEDTLKATLGSFLPATIVDRSRCRVNNPGNTQSPGNRLLVCPQLKFAMAIVAKRQ